MCACIFLIYMSVYVSTVTLASEKGCQSPCCWGHSLTTWQGTGNWTWVLTRSSMMLNRWVIFLVQFLSYFSNDCTGDRDKEITKYRNFRMLGYVSDASTNYT